MKIIPIQGTLSGEDEFGGRYEYTGEILNNLRHGTGTSTYTDFKETGPYNKGTPNGLFQFEDKARKSEQLWIDGRLEWQFSNYNNEGSILLARYKPTPEQGTIMKLSKGRQAMEFAKLDHRKWNQSSILAFSLVQPMIAEPAPIEPVFASPATANGLEAIPVTLPIAPMSELREVQEHQPEVQQPDPDLPQARMPEA